MSHFSWWFSHFTSVNARQQLQDSLENLSTNNCPNKFWPVVCRNGACDVSGHIWKLKQGPGFSQQVNLGKIRLEDNSQWGELIWIACIEKFIWKFHIWHDISLEFTGTTNPLKIFFHLKLNVWVLCTDNELCDVIG